MLPEPVDPFSAVADPRRRAILEMLTERERPVNEIVEHLGVDQPSVSKALRVLRDHGLVESLKQGRFRVYRINAQRIKAVHDWTLIFEPFWAHQLSRIKANAERRVRPAGPSSRESGKNTEYQP
ncbi:MAG: metalloregulator ArsR/SmtB family transcription factor [Phycisphaeraceae bacterium]